MASQIRVGAVTSGGRDRAVVVVDQAMRFLDEAVPGAPDDVRRLIGEWDRWRGDVLALGGGTDSGDAESTDSGGSGAPFAAADAEWVAPVTPRKLLCVGANYHHHVAEMDGPAGLTTQPAPFAFSFLKPPTALTGSGRPVPHPSYGRKLDWEAELAIVIGDPSAAAGPDPLAAVFGYTILNDLSLRDFIPFPHALGLDAVVSKGFDGAAPMGPWITLAQDVPDPQDLTIELRVNGEVMQDSSTANMIFSVRELIAHFARVLSLEPGDVIATGTPAGVGAGRQPPRFLRAGDEIEVRIGDLGCLQTTITAARADDLLVSTAGAAA